MNIEKRQKISVLVNDMRRYFTFNYFTKDAIVHTDMIPKK